LVWKIKRILEKIPFGEARIASYAAALWFIKESFNVPQSKLEERFKQTLIESFGYENEDFKRCLTESQRQLASGVYTLKNNIQSFTNDIVLLKEGDSVLVDAESVKTILGVNLYEAYSDKFDQTILITEEDIQEDAPANSAGGGNVAGIGIGAQGEPGFLIKRFMNCSVFHVDPDKFHNCLKGKHPSHKYSRYVGDDGVGEEIRSYGRKNPKENIVIQNKRTGEMVFLKRKPPVPI
jgi:hypothetical protein